MNEPLPAADARLATRRDNLASLEHSARTAVAAAVSLFVARLCRLEEAYWASITTLIVLQSTLGAALAVSAQRIVGTALGAAVGAITAAYFPGNLFVFASAIFVIGGLCAALRLGNNAYRYAGITLAIVMLITHGQRPWVVAVHRFVEVSLGIAVGLAVVMLWPQRPTGEIGQT